MKISLKQALAFGALAVASTSAFADVAIPSSGNGELMLVVWDQTTGASYARGLQVNVDNVATSAAISADTYTGAGDTSFSSYSLGTVSADANLTTFLNTAGKSDVITWAVVAGDSTGTGAANIRYVSTAATTQTDFSTVTNNVLKTSFSNLNTWGTTVNGSIELTNGTSVAGDGKSNSVQNSVNGAASGTNAGWSAAGDTWGGSLSNSADLGSSASFYLFSTSSSAGGAVARTYSLSGLTLQSDGTLVSASAAPVPVPAALWLLGSSLAGLVGIGRRKRVADLQMA